MLNRHMLLVAFFLINEIRELRNIGVTVKEQTVSRQTVTSCAPNFLIITLDALGKVEVNHKPDIRFVDPHAECDRSYNDLHVIADKRFLILTPLYIVEAGVIGTDGIALRCKIGSKFI